MTDRKNSIPLPAAGGHIGQPTPAYLKSYAFNSQAFAEFSDATKDPASYFKGSVLEACSGPLSFVVDFVMKHLETMKPSVVDQSTEPMGALRAEDTISIWRTTESWRVEIRVGSRLFVGAIRHEDVNQAASVNVTDQLGLLGLPDEVLLLVTSLCNNLRVANTAEELAVQVARADGALCGMLAGKAISKPQHDQLDGLLRVIAQKTRAQNTVFAVFQELPRTADLEESIQILLADTIRDLARQDSPEFRGQYYGECRGLLKALRLGELLDEAQRDQWSADIYRASLQSAEQCAAAGQPADESAVKKHHFQLEILTERGITPRAELPR